ncbi:beta-fructofuranosidase, insoluble isoenzyme 1-like [Aristolochia californica]|uniref:beta-fructofuranosidase, insoluble isoenzyme 1-like n=1 Tax=Aristolochia californica TaxID=171875 RepID=UPI0035E0D7AE
MAAKKVFPSPVWIVFLFYFLFILGLDTCVEASHLHYVHLQSSEQSIVSPLYRTAYHFQPPKNWINDPNGPLYYNGFYHLFYQYNPHGAVWGNIVWAHSVSKDLVNWKPLKPAIFPSKPFDINGCWSGSTTILPGNKPVILYTGIDTQNRQVQNIAVPKNLSDPYLVEWEKPDHNPLMVPNQENGINASSFRDPTTAWYADGHWKVLVGNKRGKTGMALLYRSKDFKHWVKTKHPLHSSKDTGMWECPDFYPVSEDGKRHGLDTSINGKGVKHVLKVSLDDTKFEYYTVGRYIREFDRYLPDNTSADDATGLRYDYGKFYASKTFFDHSKNRRLLWGWMNESDSVNDDVSKGWAGLQAIPRTVWLDTSGKQLLQWPIEEIESLRRKGVQVHNTRLSPGQHVKVEGITAAQADVEVTFDLPILDNAEAFNSQWTNPQHLCSQNGSRGSSSIGPFGLLVLASDNLEEYTAVYFHVFKNGNKPVVVMCSDQSRSTLRSEVDKTTYGGFVDVNLKDGKLSLRSLIDHSIIESFGAGGKTCLTARVYPTKALGGKGNLFAFNNGTQPVTISKLEAWSMARATIN